MEGLREPVGELPPEIYWRRRALLAAGMVLLIIVVWYLITSPSGGGEGEASPTPTVTATTDAPANPDTSLARPCGPTDISVITTANPYTSDANELPRFDVDIENVGDVACRLETAHEDSELLIMSGSDRIWNSTDCPDTSAINERELVLQPGAQEQFQVVWSRQRSAPECATVTAEPRPGTYIATLTLQGIESDEARFELTDDPA